MQSFTKSKLFFILLFLLLLPYTALSASLLGPSDLRINRWHYHASSHSFRADQVEKGIIKITKKTSNAAIKNGFIIFNFHLFPLADFLDGHDITLAKEINLRKRNRLFVFFRGKPRETLQIEITRKGATVKPEATINADPQSLIKGESSTLTWQTENADSIHIEPDIGSVAPSGSLLVSPELTTNYSIIATGPGGTATSQTEIIVKPPLPKIVFNADPPTIIRGESSTLSWDTEDATHCILNQGIGPVSTNGEIEVSPLVDTTYTLTADGPGGTSQISFLVHVSLEKLPVINKSQANYQTPENTLSASSSSLLSRDLAWYHQAFSQEALDYQKQLFATAGIDPTSSFNLVDENDEQYVLEKIPYKDGLLVIIEKHFNDTDGTVLTTAAGMIEENGLWKITHKYSEDEELEQYDSVRYINCIASYTFSPDSYEDMCEHGNDLTHTHSTDIALDNRNAEDLTTAKFNGVDSALGRELLLDMPDDQISFGGWIKAQQADHVMTVIEIGNPTENSIAITIGPGFGVSYRAFLGGQLLENKVGMDYDYHDNSWHHLYLTYDGTSLKLYIDGVLQDSQVFMATIDAQPMLNIGQSNGTQGNPSQFFMGMIDDLQIFNRALTDNQVLQNFER